MRRSGSFIPSLARLGTRGAAAASAILLAVIALPSSAEAAPNLTIRTITWNVIGLDSNNPTGSGPDRFPVGARICNTGTTGATNVASTFVWDSVNSFVNTIGPSSLALGNLAAGACVDAYYNVTVSRTSSAHNTARGYHITATADTLGTVQTPANRELFVEKLVSQNRNGLLSITGAAIDVAPTAGAPGHASVVVGQTYTFVVTAKTATGGYEQLESFLDFPNTIFQVLSTSSTYSQPSGATNDALYADACGWENATTSGNYRSCVGPENFTGGKAGGNPISTTYTVKVIAAGSGAMSTLIYDFSGSSFHYNNDFGLNLTTLNFDAATAPDPAITKTHTGNFTVGTNGTYTVTVSNVGGLPTSGTTTVTDVLPAGLSFVSGTGTGFSCSAAGQTVTCTRASAITAGSSVPITLTVGVAAGAVPSVTNTATVANAGDTNAANNSASDPTTVNAAPPVQADLAVVKSGPASVNAGGSIAYTISVTNNGPATATTPTVTDVLPGNLGSPSTPTAGCSISSGTLSCTLANLASGASAAVTLTGTAPASGTVANTATVSSTTTDPNPANNSSTVSTAVSAQADLALVKSGPATVNAGGTITYTLTVTNNGPSTASATTVTDTIPAGLASPSTPTAGCSISAGTLTCTLGDLASGSSSAITLTGTAPASGTVTNTATVSSTTNDPNPANNAGTAITTVTAQADLALVKSGPATVNAGGTITYTLTVTNNGPSAASATTVTDSIPAGLSSPSTPTAGCSITAGTLTCTLGDLANGASTTITLTGTAPASGTVTNTATVSSTTNDPNPANNAGTASTTVTAQADLALVKSGPASVNAGGAITYTLTVTNNGPSTASATTVTDTIPAGLGSPSTPTAGCSISAGTLTCTLGDLANGASTAITLTGTAPTSGTVTNTATVSSVTTDPNPANNAGTASTTVTAQADLALVKSGPASVNAGGAITYTLTVTNNGPSTASAPTVTDSLPAGLTSPNTPTAGCSISAGTLTCTLGNLASGASSVITLTGTAPASGTVTNTATVSSTSGDPNPANNASTVSTSVTPAPVTPQSDLSLAKALVGSLTAGQQATYAMTVTNLGLESVAGPLTVTDTLPAGLAFVSGGGNGWTCSAAGQVVTCTRATALGAVASVLTIVVDVTAASGAPIVNTAVLSTVAGEQNVTNNNSSASAVVLSATSQATTTTTTAAPATTTTTTAAPATSAATAAPTPTPQVVDSLPVTGFPTALLVKAGICLLMIGWAIALATKRKSGRSTRRF